MKEILNEIQNIQSYLHGGYKSQVVTNIDWLDVSKKKAIKVKNFKIESY